MSRCHDGRSVGTAKAARWLNKPERTIRDWCEKGKLEGADQPVFNTMWLIPVTTLEAIRPTPADKTLINDIADVADIADSEPVSLDG